MIIHFYKKRYIYFAISLVLILSGVIAALVNGIQMDTQFKGGTILKYTYSGTIDADKAGSIVKQTVGTLTTGQLQTNLALKEKILVLSLAENQALTAQDQTAVSTALNKAFPNSKLSLSNSLTVEPFVGARFFRRGIIAIAISFLLILIYVGFRFRRIGGFSAGTMAIIALIHDALMVTTAFVLFRIPLNDSFIAAVLSIIGFSINDTIVIYDRIRENEKLIGKKMPIDELVDLSITQSMSRSIITNIAVFASITIAYIFAQVYDIESIRSFALPMMFGTVSGCYSTICIAGPLWVMWKRRKIKPQNKLSTSKA